MRVLERDQRVYSPGIRDIPESTGQRRSVGKIGVCRYNAPILQQLQILYVMAPNFLRDSPTKMFAVQFPQVNQTTHDLTRDLRPHLGRVPLGQNDNSIDTSHQHIDLADHHRTVSMRNVAAY